jgi:hypothetical protein
MCPSQVVVLPAQFLRDRTEGVFRDSGEKG